MSTLDELGARHTELREELAKLTARTGPLQEAMRAERAAGATQSDIMIRSGYKTIQQVRVILGEANNPKERT